MSPAPAEGVNRDTATAKRGPPRTNPRIGSGSPYLWVCRTKLDPLRSQIAPQSDVDRPVAANHFDVSTNRQGESGPV